MWHVTRDMWHVTRDMWLITRDMWHMTHDKYGRINILSKFQLPSSSGLGMRVFRRYFDYRMSQSMNEWVTEVIVEQPRVCL